jgi:hypothetical protein
MDHGCNPVGLDLSHGMLLRGQQVGPRALVQGDLRRVPFVTAQLGGVRCAAALLHLPLVNAGIPGRFAPRGDDRRATVGERPGR